MKVFSWHSRRKIDREIAGELDAHIGERVDDLVDEGLSPEAARRQAVRELGSRTRIREIAYDDHGWPKLDGIVSDVRLAFRNVARRPAYAAATILTLALGIAATTTVFAVVDGVFLSGLPYEEPSRLVTIGSLPPGGALVAPGVFDLGPVSIFHYQRLRERARSFEVLGAINDRRLMPLATPDGEINLPAREISPEILDLFDTGAGQGGGPSGRAFIPEEYGAAEEGAVMVTHEEWQTRFGGDPDLVGTNIGRIRGGRFPAVVVGILPEGFRPLEAFFAGGDAPGYYFPEAPASLAPDRGWEPWYVVGRLRAGVPFEAAHREVAAIAEEVAREFPDAVGVRQPNGGAYRIAMNGLEAQTLGASRPVFALFTAASVLFLVLAALNAGSLILARSLDRAREFGIRTALGAGRLRLVGLVSAESTVLVSAAGLAGLAGSLAGIRMFLAYAPLSIPRLHVVEFEPRTALAAAGLTVVAGLLAGFVPAVRIARTGASDIHATRPPRLRRVMAGGQMALAIVLVSIAALLFHSFVRLRTVDPGFNPAGLLRVTVAYKESPSMRTLPTSQAWDRILDELATVPGVEEFAGTTAVPFQAPFARVRVRFEGESGGWREDVAAHAITPDYPDLMGIPLISGRSFETTDHASARPVALVNEAFVRFYLDGGARPDPIGQSFFVDQTEGALQIVGVVGDVIGERAEDGYGPAVYLPYTQVTPGAFMVAVVRSPRLPEGIVEELASAAGGFMPGGTPTVAAMDDLMAASRMDPRFRTWLVGAFALVAALVAAAGIHGTLAHFVRGHRRELAIRMAIGADGRGLLAAVLGRGLKVTLAGLGVGLGATLAATRLVSGLVFGIDPADPATLALAFLALIAVSLLACLGPAIHAARIAPLEVLREE